MFLNIKGHQESTAECSEQQIPPGDSEQGIVKELEEQKNSANQCKRDLWFIVGLLEVGKWGLKPQAQWISVPMKFS